MNSITSWDHLEEAVDQLAAVFEVHLRGPDEVVCSLQFEEAEALAEVLEAGMHQDVAARLMHCWALTEPDWDDEHGDTVRRWLSIDVGAEVAASSRPGVADVV